MSEREEPDHPLHQSRASLPTRGSVIVQRRKAPRRAREDQPYLTYLLILLNSLIFLLGLAAPALELELFLRGALIPRLVSQNGEFYRLLTAMFLHGSMGHVFFNMYALYIIGRDLEPIFGRLRLLLIYLLGGLTGSVISLALGGIDGASVGASGAVFAIFAAEAVHLYQNRQVYASVRARLQHMGILIAINLVIGFLPGSRIDNWGHIGGMLGGALLAWRIAPRLARPTEPPRSLRDIAKTDSNPLHSHAPELVLYIFALIGIAFFAISLLLAQ